MDHLEPRTEVYGTRGYFAARLPHDVLRGPLWRVLCSYLQRYIPDQAEILELGGGYCDFINNIRSGSRHVIDLFPDLPRYAAKGVTPHVQSCTDLDEFPDNQFACIFASNLFEHLTREQLYQTLAECRRVLRPNGRLILIQPNFRYCYRQYFDDYTHIQIFTHLSMCDLLTSAGFHPVAVVARFLPFSIKGRAPKWPWLLRVYLCLPWRPFAGQMLIVAESTQSHECHADSR